MDKVKDDVFVQQVMEKIGEDDYLDILANAGYTSKAK